MIFLRQNTGKSFFATHLYESHSGSGIDAVKQSYNQDLGFSRDFVSATGRGLLVTEYAVAGIGGGKSDDPFPYGDLMRWVNQQFSEFAIGSHIWNFKSWDGYPPWGPVVNKCGSGGIPWNDIWSEYPSPTPPAPPTPSSPTPAPTSPGPSPPSPSGAGQCCYGGCGQSCQGGWCGQSEEHCTGNCNGQWCPSVPKTSSCKTLQRPCTVRNLHSIAKSSV